MNEDEEPTSARTAVVTDPAVNRVTVLHIEHPVVHYDSWKAAFDSDPVGRARRGVRRHRILRGLDDPNFVMIDLEFDTPAEAAGLLDAMQTVWDRVAGVVVSSPRAVIVESVETQMYA